MKQLFLSACVIACCLTSCNNEDETNVLDKQKVSKIITVPVNQDVEIIHGGTGLALKLRCELSSYIP